jgi:hypothetical protein
MARAFPGMTALLTFVLITLVARLGYCAGRMDGLREAFTAIDRGEEAHDGHHEGAWGVGRPTFSLKEGMGDNAPSHVSREEAARAA